MNAIGQIVNEGGNIVTEGGLIITKGGQIITASRQIRKRRKTCRESRTDYSICYVVVLMMSISNPLQLPHNHRIDHLTKLVN